MPNTLLSILICGLEERVEQHNALCQAIREMASDQPVEVLSHIDNREMPTGEKRNKLMERAQGEYIAFVDDDDSVSSDYIDSICAALATRPDAVGIEGVIIYIPPTISVDGSTIAQAPFIHSIECGGWYAGGDGVFYRTPNHLNPVRRDIALSVRFNPFLYVGEDSDYSKRLAPRLKTEVMIDTGPIYFYKYDWMKRKKK